MKGQILTFSNLFPSAARPRHGCFVQDRMQRVVERAQLDWQVLVPVPRVPWPLRRSPDRSIARLPTREEVEGVSVRHLPYFHLPGLSLGRQARRMARACLPMVRQLAADQPTVLDAHYLYPDGVAALLIAGELSLPCVVTARGSDLNVLARRPEVAQQIQEVAGSARALLGVSRALCDRLAELTGLGANVQLARNGVDLERFGLGEKASARAALDLPEECPLLLCVGRLVPSKGFKGVAAVLAAAGQTKGKGVLHDAVLVVVGEGPERDSLASMLPAARIHFLGGLPRKALVKAYQASDLLVLPSYREGWPNVVTEALACGLPVLASNVGGIPEILTDPEVSAMVPPGDGEALRREVQRLLEHPPSRARVRRLAECYSWDDTVEMLSGLFLEVLA